MDFEIANDNFIDIMVKKNGKKTNTYISGWDIDDILLKQHLLKLKKLYGCGGSITNINKDDNNIKVLHLQGDRSEMVLLYLINQGINKDLIKIKN